ncbi:MAG TPA: 7TM-DISM domain-containing protein, partial [Pseudomonas sp.]|nr:7TM-DISM domain-containing protein [Pseudomonas sp.]
MRWLRIATRLIIALMTLLCVPMAFAEVSAGWSTLVDDQATLQLSDVRSPHYDTQFSPIELDKVRATRRDSALWLHYRLAPTDHEQLVRIFAPDLATVDMYVLDGENLISHSRSGNKVPRSAQPLPSIDFLLPVPRSERVLDLYLRMQSEQELRPNISLESAVSSAADERRPLLLGLFFGSLIMLIVQNITRFAQSRSVSSLWLAACEGFLGLSALLLLNLQAPLLPHWHLAQTPSAHLALLLAAATG